MTNHRLTVPTNPARALRDLNRQTPIVPLDLENDDETEIHNNTTILQSDKPTDLQTSRATDNQTNNTDNQPTTKPANQQTSRPTDRQTSPQTDKLANKAMNKKQSSNPAPTAPEPVARPVRVDGRTLRPRQDTADQTMVTSMRLAVSTLELLDDYCYQHRQRKQDVVQAALDMYFAEDAASE